MSSSSPLPLHLVAEDSAGNPTNVKRKPGRPRKIRPAPTADELQYAAEVNLLRDHHVENDHLVQALDQHAGSLEILDRCAHDLARESAILRFEIRSAQAASRSTGVEQLMNRRIDALHKLALVSMGRRKLDMIDLDPTSDSVQRVFAAFLDSITNVATQVLPDAEPFLEQCREALDGWESRLE